MADVLDALREFAFGDGAPLTITVEKPLTAHGQRLADSLGVLVEVRPVTSQATSGRSMGSYIVPAPSFAKPDGPRVDWIDYRASIARAHRREQNGDEPLTCPGCGTETDVTDVVHSPKCEHVAAAPAPPIERETMPEVECKVDGCDRDASDAPAKGFTARLCAVHRAEKSAAISAARTGKPRGAKGTGTAKPKRSTAAAKPPKPAAAPATTNGSIVSKAERLLAAARAVDEIEQQLDLARAELQDAAAALA